MSVFNKRYATWQGQEPTPIKWDEIHAVFGLRSEGRLLTDEPNIEWVVRDHHVLLNAVRYIRVTAPSVSATTRVALFTHWIRFRRDNKNSIEYLLRTFDHNPSFWVGLATCDGQILFDDLIVGLWIDANCHPGRAWTKIERGEYSLLWCVHQLYRRGVFRHAPGQWDVEKQEVGFFTAPMRSNAKKHYGRPLGEGPWDERIPPPALAVHRGNLIFDQFTTLPPPPPPPLEHDSDNDAEASELARMIHRERQLRDSRTVQQLGVSMTNVFGTSDSSLSRWLAGTLTPPPLPTAGELARTLTSATIASSTEHRRRRDSPSASISTSPSIIIIETSTTSSSSAAADSDDADFIPREHDAFGDPIFLPGEPGHIDAALVEAAELAAKAHPNYIFEGVDPSACHKVPLPLRMLRIKGDEKKKLVEAYRARHARYERRRLALEEVELQRAVGTDHGDDTVRASDSSSLFNNEDENEDAEDELVNASVRTAASSSRNSPAAVFPPPRSAPIDIPDPRDQNTRIWAAIAAQNERQADLVDRVDGVERDLFRLSLHTVAAADR